MKILKVRSISWTSQCPTQPGSDHMNMEMVKSLMACVDSNIVQRKGEGMGLIYQTASVANSKLLGFNEKGLRQNCVKLKCIPRETGIIRVNLN